MLVQHVCPMSCRSKNKITPKILFFPPWFVQINIQTTKMTTKCMVFWKWIAEMQPNFKSYNESKDLQSLNLC